MVLRRKTSGSERLVREAGERVRGAPNSVRVRCQQLRISGSGGAEEGGEERDLRGMREKFLASRQPSKTREELLQGEGGQDVLPLLWEKIRETIVFDLARGIGPFDHLFEIANPIGEFICVNGR